MIVPFRTIFLGPDENDPVQRRDLSGPQVLHQFRISYDPGGITADEESLLYEFWVARRGRYGKFNFFSFDHHKKWVDISIGTGNGTQDDFTLPGKETSSVVVKVAGATKELTTDYIITENAGTDYQTVITFNPGKIPTTGQAVTVSFTGRRYFPDCVFKTSAAEFRAFGEMLYSVGLEIMQVSR